MPAHHSRMIRWPEERSALYTWKYISVENSEGNSLLEILGSRWKCNVDVGLKMVIKVWSGSS